jgi:hypothetical protein
MTTADSQTIEAALDAQAEAGQSPYFLALDAGEDETGQTPQFSAINYLFREQEKTKGTFVEIIVTEASGINVLITRPLTERVHRDAQWWHDASQQGVAGIGIVDPHLDENSQQLTIG